MDPQAFQLLIDRFDRVEEGLDEIKSGLNTHGGRISSLEDTRTRQKGVMIGGGMMVTFCASLFTWLVDHWGKS